MILISFTSSIIVVFDTRTVLNTIGHLKRTCTVQRLQTRKNDLLFKGTPGTWEYQTFEKVVVFLQFAVRNSWKN